MLVYSIIPARGGSKRIPKKNIKLLNNKPLIHYSIEQSLQCPEISRTFVSTDSVEIASAIQHFPITTIQRPTQISQDLSTDKEFITHFMEYLTQNSIPIPNYIVQLRPTYPTRHQSLLSATINILINNPQYSSLRTVIPTEKTPFKTYTINNNNQLTPLFTLLPNIHEPYNQPAQILPQTYQHNGCIDIINTQSFQQTRSITGNNICPYIMDASETYDIDTFEDFSKVEKKLCNKS